MRFLMMLAYRVNYYSGIIIYSINIGAYYFLWKAIYGGAESLGGLSSLQMTTYVAVAWMARAFYFNNLDREMAVEIREGKVAIEMIRPYNYLIMKTMMGLGEGIFRLVFFSVPGLLLVMLLFPMQLPADGTVWLLYLASLLFSFIINTQINLITGVLSFFFFSNMGFMHAKRVIVDLLSGLVLPISFFPLWAQEIMGFLPFQAISYLPTMIFTGGLGGEAALKGMLLQAVWIVVLLIPLQLLWMKARKTLVVQGG